MIEEDHGLSRHGAELRLQIHSHSFANLSVLFCEVRAVKRRGWMGGRSSDGGDFGEERRWRRLDLIPWSAETFGRVGVETRSCSGCVEVTVLSCRMGNPHTPSHRSCCAALPGMLSPSASSLCGLVDRTERSSIPHGPVPSCCSGLCVCSAMCGKIASDSSSW